MLSCLLWSYTTPNEITCTVKEVALIIINLDFYTDIVIYHWVTSARDSSVQEYTSESAFLAMHMDKVFYQLLKELNAHCTGTTLAAA